MGNWINIRPKVHIYALDEGAVFFVPIRLFVEAFCLIALLVGEVPQVEEGSP